MSLIATQGNAESHTTPQPVLVLGLGNILMRDEGIGVRVVEKLQLIDLPPAVEVLDGATAGFDLLEVLAGRQKVIVIDAMDGNFEPGTVVKITPDDLRPRDGQCTSLHDLGLPETLSLARQLGSAPQEVVIFGIQPHNIGYGLALSPDLARMVPRIVELVRAELADTTPPTQQPDDAPEPGGTAAQERQGE